MIIYLNEQFMPAEHARISPFDRGFIFGDGLYEGLRSFAGSILALDDHIQRLAEGLEKVGIDWDAKQAGEICRELISVNNLPNAFIYFQVSRGTPGPDEPVRQRVAGPGTKPTIFAFCTPTPSLCECQTPGVITASVQEDLRWSLGTVKSTSLMGNVMAAIHAEDAGVQDVLLVRRGLVAEASAANVVVVLTDGQGHRQIVTPSLESVPILAGVTRKLILQHHTEIIERTVRVEELATASEIIEVGTLAMVSSIVRLDGRVIGDGTPGPVAQELLDTLHTHIQSAQHAQSHAVL